VLCCPELVLGTLEKGFEIYRAVELALHRAIFMMFLVSEVHPFLDGNGRIARIMMNAELVAQGEQRIIIPTVYRNNYVSALKALSQSGKSTPMVQVLDFAQRYTTAIRWEDFDRAREDLQSTMHSWMPTRLKRGEFGCYCRRKQGPDSPNLAQWRNAEGQAQI